MTTRTPIDDPDAEGSRKWCLVRQTVAASVDFGNLDMIRDPAPVEVRLAAQQRLLLLHSCLGADLFATLRMACFDCLELGEIGQEMGLGNDESRYRPAVARECRVALRRAADVYATLSVVEAGDGGIEQPVGWGSEIGALKVAANDNRMPLRRTG